MSAGGDLGNADGCLRDVLRGSEIFRGLAPEAVDRFARIARRESLPAGERPFALGEEARNVYVVLEGTVDMCLPISVHGVLTEVTIERQGTGSAIGWSAFVRPHRFRLSARVSEACVLAAFPRADLSRLFEEDPPSGCVVMTRVAELVGRRLLTMQALWARELQRAVAAGLPTEPEPAQPEA